MPHIFQFDLRGKRIEDTYAQLLQVDSASNKYYNGTGYQQDLMALSSSYAGVADVSTSSSWASQSLNSFFATYSDIATIASQSLGIRGLTIITPPTDPTFTTTYPAIAKGAPLISNEGNPHVLVKANGKIYGSGWGGNLFRINDPDGAFLSIDTSSFGGGITYVSDGVYSSETGYLYFCTGEGIYQVDPFSLAVTKVFSYPAGVFGNLPPLKIHGEYIYYAPTQPAPIQFLKINVHDFSAVTSSVGWTSASVNLSGCHGSAITPDGQYLFVTNPSGHIARVKTSDMTWTTVTVRDPGGIGLNYTDDCCVLGESFYATSEFDVYVSKTDINTLTSEVEYDNANSYGIWTDGYDVYMDSNGAGLMYVYPNGDISNGPIIFSLTGFGSWSANELIWSDKGYAIMTKWLTGEIWRYTFPLFLVGIDKVPTTTLDVGGPIQSDSSLSGSSISVTGNATVGGSETVSNTITFGGILRDTASNFTVTQAGTVRSTAVTASLGFFGTASWAISASWAPTGVSSTAISASWASQSLSASWAPGSNTQVSCSWASQSYSTSYSPWADFARSASWASASISSSYALTASYSVTSSYVTQSVTQSIISSSFSSQSFFAVSASWASQSLSASWAPPQVSCSWASASISASYAISASWSPPQGVTAYAVSASWASQSLSASWVPNLYPQVPQISCSWASASISASYAISASWAPPSGVTQTAVSASWASQSIWSTTSSYASASSTAISASWASASLVATSASFASRSISASWADAANAVLVTGATYQITASWAINVVNGGSPGTATSQSSIDVSMRDMQFPFSGAAFSGIGATFLNGSYIDTNLGYNRLQNGAPSAQGMVYWYLAFPNENLAGGNEQGAGTTASLAFHQMRAPANFNNGLTHSFQYFAMGAVDSTPTPIEGEIPGANNKVYWIVDLYAITSSTSAASNFFSAPVKVGRVSTTKSFSGAIGTSGSLETVVSMFNDPNGYITENSILSITVIRYNSDSSSIWQDFSNSPDFPGGDHTDYTGSVAMVTSRFNWNAAS